LDWQPPHAKWFVGGKLNVSENCLDRHLGTARENKAALIFEGEPGDVRTITYKQLHFHVCRLAHIFENMGIGAGDRVAIYMPMIPEAVMAMLACARVGAVHTVVFGGFSPEALKDRINDCKAKLVITADGGWRRGKVIELKANVDKAVEGAPSVHTVMVVRRCGNPVTMVEGRDVWWKDAWDGAPNAHKAKAFDSEHPLFILYTSGSTGKPKGVLHTSAGYLLGAQVDARSTSSICKENDVYFVHRRTSAGSPATATSCTVRWPTARRSSSTRAPRIYPEPDRFWQMIDRHGVTILYTAPTAIRAFMQLGRRLRAAKHDLLDPCVCSAPSASRSTPRPGCGTTS
jgi:acetyl-CoA synthetase